MIALKKAVYDKIVGGMDESVHWGTAPAGTAFPYIVLNTYSIVAPEQFIGVADMIAPVTIRVTVWAATMEAVDGLIQELEVLFIGQALVTDTGNVMDVAPGGLDSLLDPDRDPAAGEVWQGVFDLNITYQRQPGE